MSEISVPRMLELWIKDVGALDLRLMNTCGKNTIFYISVRYIQMKHAVEYNAMSPAPISAWAKRLLSS